MAGCILVVEDDKNIREVVTEYLKDAGFDVLSAETGGCASEIIQQNSDLSLFVLDIMLPEISGLELLRIIREGRYKTTPVIMLTALGDEYTQLLSFEGFADDYVTKPFSPKILVKRVEALLRRNRNSENLLRIGGIAINADGYEAFENGTSIPLTLKETEILKALLQNKSMALSRQQLLNTVWGYDYYGDERIVDVHIKNLRKKFSCDIITTVKGVGYKIEIPQNQQTERDSV